MYELSFVFENNWCTVVGDRDSIATLKLILENSKLIEDSVRHFIQMNKVGVR